MNFSEIHFCAEEIIKRFIRSNWLNEFESIDITNFKRRRHGLFKNILISQNDRDRQNKWRKNNSGNWELTHRSGKGADNSKNTVALENGHFVEFEINGDSYQLKLMKDDEPVSDITFSPNWQESALEDFRRGKNKYLQENPEGIFVVEECEYQLYIDFLSSLFSTNENEEENIFDPYHKTYLALFEAYNSDITDKAKTVIETTMGAMIFYMPQSVEQSWSKKISRQCFLESLQEKVKKMVKDHEIPRKFAAKICLQRNEPFDLEEFTEQYWRRFSGFTYVTTNENRRLVNWYLDEQNINEEGEYNYEKALKSLQIEYISLDGFTHRRINGLIRSVRENDHIDHTVWTEELEEFIHNQIEDN